MKIERVELILLKAPLVHYFETSFGRVTEEEHIIVKLYSEGLIGYGESAVMAQPLYSSETIGTCWHVLKDFLVPLVLKGNFDSVEEFIKIMEPIKGHNFAKMGIESAFWCLLSQKEKMSLSQLFGGEKKYVDVGVSLGIQDSIDELLKRVEHHLNLKYKRIKVKIKPGWDIEVLRAIRKNFGDILLSVDANTAYNIKMIEIFKEMDELKLLMIEQPFNTRNFVDHAVLQENISTAVCLDESIECVDDARLALKQNACKIINIKPGRVGGLSESIKIHDLCMENNIPVWCGGMLEFGIGRAFNVALSSLQNFKLPGDISSSKRYYKEDILETPIEAINGQVNVSSTPGLGYVVVDDLLKKYTIRAENFS